MIKLCNRAFRFIRRYLYHIAVCGCILVWGIFIAVFANDYVEKKAEQEETAKEQFLKAFEDVFNRDYPKYRQNLRYDSNLKKKTKDTLVFASKDFVFKKAVKDIKKERHISYDSFVRMRHSSLMAEKEVTVDTIYRQFSRYPEVQGWGDYAILYVWGKKDSLIAGNPALVCREDSLTDCKIGLTGECAFALYGKLMKYQIWKAVVRHHVVTIFILVVLGIVLLGLFLFRWFRKVPIVSENPVNIEGKQIVRLGAGVSYNSRTNLLYNEQEPERSVTLYNRDSNLLMAFFQADNQELDISMIKKLVWKKKEVSDNTVRHAIKSLNGHFEEVSSNIKIRSLRGTYRLFVDDVTDSIGNK